MADPGKVYEEILLNGLKSDFGIVTNKHNKSIKILMRQYFYGEINKEQFIGLLECFSKTEGI